MKFLRLVTLLFVFGSYAQNASAFCMTAKSCVKEAQTEWEQAVVKIKSAYTMAETAETESPTGCLPQYFEETLASGVTKSLGAAEKAVNHSDVANFSSVARVKTVSGADAADMTSKLAASKAMNDAAATKFAECNTALAKSGANLDTIAAKLQGSMTACAKIVNVSQEFAQANDVVVRANQKLTKAATKCSADSAGSTAAGSAALTGLGTAAALGAVVSLPFLIGGSSGSSGGGGGKGKAYTPSNSSENNASLTPISGSDSTSNPTALNTENPVGEVDQALVGNRETLRSGAEEILPGQGRGAAGSSAASGAAASGLSSGAGVSSSGGTGLSSPGVNSGEGRRSLASIGDGGSSGGYGGSGGGRYYGGGRHGDAKEEDTTAAVVTQISIDNPYQKKIQIVRNGKKVWIDNPYYKRCMQSASCRKRALRVKSDPLLK